MTLLATANASTTPAGTALEVQMKEMFRKMREFNAADPNMLARLWQQERDEYLSADLQEKDTGAVTDNTLRATSPKANTSSARKPRSTQAKKIKVVLESSISATPGAPTVAPFAPNASLARPMTNIPTSGPQSVRPAASAASQVTPAAPVTPVVPLKPVGTITWPADKKQTLTAAASKILQDMPGNTGKLISPAQISEILDNNPAYIELCTAIESLGFKVDRVQFACKLL